MSPELQVALVGIVFTLIVVAWGRYVAYAGNLDVDTIKQAAKLVDAPKTEENLRRDQVSDPVAALISEDVFLSGAYKVRRLGHGRLMVSNTAMSTRSGRKQTKEVAGVKRRRVLQPTSQRNP